MVIPSIHLRCAAASARLRTRPYLVRAGSRESAHQSRSPLAVAAAAILHRRMASPPERRTAAKPRGSRPDAGNLGRPGLPGSTLARGRGLAGIGFPLRPMGVQRWPAADSPRRSPSPSCWVSSSASSKRPPRRTRSAGSQAVVPCRAGLDGLDRTPTTGSTLAPFWSRVDTRLRVTYGCGR